MDGPEFLNLPFGSRGRNSTLKKNHREENSAKELENPFYIHRRTEVRRRIPDRLNTD